MKKHEAKLENEFRLDRLSNGDNIQVHAFTICGYKFILSQKNCV